MFDVFKARLRGGETLMGTFVKTPSFQVVEILGVSGLDFLVLDAEHAPFDRGLLDVCALAARSTGTPTLVRLPSTSATDVLQVLDLGFAGVLAPHAVSPDGIERLVSACRYMGGTRGFSNSPRAGSYGAIGMGAHIRHSDKQAALVCQIEDREAIERLPELVAVDAVDAFLIGRADLAVSYGSDDIGHPTVVEAVGEVIGRCREAGKVVGLFVGSPQEIPKWASQGVSMFIAGSDQSMLRQQSASLVAQLSPAKEAAKVSIVPKP